MTLVVCPFKMYDVKSYQIDKFRQVLIMKFIILKKISINIEYWRGIL